MREPPSLSAMAAQEIHDPAARRVGIRVGEMDSLFSPAVAFGGHFAAELTATCAARIGYYDVCR